MRQKYIIRRFVHAVLNVNKGQWLPISDIVDEIELRYGWRYTQKQVYNAIVDDEALFRDTTDGTHTYSLLA